MYKKPFDFETEDYDNLSTSQLKRMADYWQRKYLLKNAERNGVRQIYCPLKKKYFNEDKMNVSHFIDRRHLETRYEDNNCHLISEKSNVWDSKIPKEGYKSLHHYEYEMWLREKIGDKKVEKLLDIKENFSIFARSKYIEYIKKFRHG